MSTSLYDKYGGFGSVNKVVMAFYDNLLDSDEIGPYFDDVDMPKLIDHQTKFVAMLLGGPVSYSESQLEKAHHTLGITDAHFDEMKQILYDTLTANGFEQPDADTVIEEIDARKPYIVVEQS